MMDESKRKAGQDREHWEAHLSVVDRRHVRTTHELGRSIFTYSGRDDTEYMAGIRKGRTMRDPGYPERMCVAREEAEAERVRILRRFAADGRIPAHLAPPPEAPEDAPHTNAEMELAEAG